MGIKKRLLIAFFSIIATLLISEFFSVAMGRVILARHTALSDNMIAEYHLIEGVSSLVDSLNRRIKSPNDKKEINRFNQVYSETRQLLSKVKGIIVNSESKVVFAGLENNINDVYYDVEIAVNELSSGDYLEAVSRYNEAVKKNSFVQENVTTLLLKELNYAEQLHAEVANVQNVIQIIIIILLIITAIGCVWYAIVFSNKLVLPLINLTKLAKIIENGGFGVMVDDAMLKDNTELASLARSFNTMVISLRTNIQKLGEYIIEIQNSRKLLKAEKSKLQQYLDVAGVIVLIFDVNNKVFLINKKGREILGVKASEVIGKDWVDGYVAKKSQANTKSMLAFLYNNEAEDDTMENVLIAKDKSEKNIVWHFSKLKNQNNLSEAILATGVDVTELTKAKITINQLKEVDKLKNEVLNIATHELKTPLISIVGLSEVMEKAPKTTPTEYQNFISIIHQEGIKLSNLIKTMLTASRNEVGKISAVKEKFSLIELINSLKIPLEMLAKRSESQIKFNLKETDIKLESDKAKISQVIYNFVDNAVKYGPNKQIIEVNLFLPDKNNVRVEVKGAGAGISKESQQKLFMKFSQLEPSLSRSQDGMGLGLYICKQNIENLGGQIGVESELDKGATFYFILPLINK